MSLATAEADVQGGALARLEELLYRPFIPPLLAGRAELLPRLRIFLLSHLLGPVIGLLLAAYLIALEGHLDPKVTTIIVGMLAFWAYPPALRFTGRFTLLALLSLEHLTFIILFASYCYGGMGSPFFFWLAVVPLFGFFYLGDIPRLNIAILGLLAVSLVLYLAAYRMLGPPAGAIALGGNNVVTLMSVLAAAFYVMTMALSHARLLRWQNDLLRRSESQRAMSEQLLFAKEAAEAASRAKSEFLATTSHELRTPLNAIIGFAELMRSLPSAPQEGRFLGYVRDIEASGKHLLEMINDILDVAKAESGRLDLVEEEVDLRQVLAASLRLLRGRAVRGGLSLTMRVPHDLPRVTADRRRIKQVFMNLLGNAIKFTPPGGSISILAEMELNGALALRFTDTGIGIDKAQMDQVLQPFYQVDNSLARRNEGLGLGLTLVASVMARHGGNIEMTSTIGKGTAVTVRFPAHRVARIGRQRLHAASR